MLPPPRYIYFGVHAGREGARNYGRPVACAMVLSGLGGLAVGNFFAPRVNQPCLQRLLTAFLATVRGVGVGSGTRGGGCGWSLGWVGQGWYG